MWCMGGGLDLDIIIFFIFNDYMYYEGILILLL